MKVKLQTFVVAERAEAPKSVGPLHYGLDCWRPATVCTTVHNLSEKVVSVNTFDEQGANDLTSTCE